MQRLGNKLFVFIKEKESHFSGSRALKYYYTGLQVCWGYGCALSSPFDLPHQRSSCGDFFYLSKSSFTLLLSNCFNLMVCKGKGIPNLVVLVFSLHVIAEWDIWRFCGPSPAQSTSTSSSVKAGCSVKFWIFPSMRAPHFPWATYDRIWRLSWQNLFPCHPNRFCIVLLLVTVVPHPFTVHPREKCQSK